MLKEHIVYEKVDTLHIYIYTYIMYDNVGTFQQSHAKSKVVCKKLGTGIASFVSWKPQFVKELNPPNLWAMCPGGPAYTKEWYWHSVGRFGWRDMIRACIEQFTPLWGMSRRLFNLSA